MAHLRPSRTARPGGPGQLPPREACGCPLAPSADAYSREKEWSGRGPEKRRSAAVGSFIPAFEDDLGRSAGAPAKIKEAGAAFAAPASLRFEFTWERVSRPYFAKSTAFVSRMTLTLIWPGYSSSFSIFLARSCASRIMLSSVTSSGLTMMRTSRPA